MRADAIGSHYRWELGLEQRYARRIFLFHYTSIAYTQPPMPIKWREVKELVASAEQITSPYDIEARFSTKRGQDWVGYKVVVGT
jgi:hypothetical protein